MPGPPQERSRWPKAFLALLAAVSCTSCNQGDSSISVAKKNATGGSHIATAGGANSASTATPLDPRSVPTQALLKLEGLSLLSEPPCSDTIDTLRPTLQSIAQYRAQLAAAKTNIEAMRVLTALAAELSSRLPSTAARSETRELRRLSAELAAALSDLAESLRLASTALGLGDSIASAKMMRRIENGIENTRSSIERLIAQCD